MINENLGITYGLSERSQEIIDKQMTDYTPNPIFKKHTDKLRALCAEASSERIIYEKYLEGLDGIVEEIYWEGYNQKEIQQAQVDITSKELDKEKS